jgi:hypothetical protein
VNREGDVFGVRIGFFLKSDEDSMVSVNRWLVAARKPNAFLQNAIEAACALTAD